MKQLLARWRARNSQPSRLSGGNPAVAQELRVVYHLDQFWCDRFGMFFRGWILCLDSPARRLTIAVGEDSEALPRLTSRPDLAPHFPHHDVSMTGFSHYVACSPGEPVVFTLETDTGKQSIPIRIPKATRPVVPSGATPSAELRVAYHLDHYWCDKYGMFFDGWIACLESPVRRFTITVGEDSEEVPELTQRTDLNPPFPQQDVSMTGFTHYIACAPGEQVIFTVGTDRGSLSIPVKFPKATLPIGSSLHDIHHPAWGTFVDEVNSRRLTVLEIGSRLIHTDQSINCRSYFPNARRYIGLDIHAAANVDVVGDVHSLSTLLGHASVDAVFSRSVLEHLLYPWIVAREINRVLTTGGLVFHSTPQAWPMHETPNDFWRFSDEGLKLLFGPETGFEIIDAYMINPFYMHPQERRGPHSRIPLFPGYGDSIILSRKVRDIDPASILWPVSTSTSRERAMTYPQKPPLPGHE